MGAFIAPRDGKYFLTYNAKVAGLFATFSIAYGAFSISTDNGFNYTREAEEIIEYDAGMSTT